MTRRRRSSRQQQKTSQSGITRLQIGIVAGIAIIMVLAFIVLTQGAGEEPDVLAGIDLSAIPSGLTEDGDPVLGTSDAPVTIVEFSDYQCSHCASFSKNTLPEIIKNYITSGKVRYIHNDAAILGQQSHWAAQAARCAADQDHFWEYHEFLFQKQGGGSEAFSRDNLKQYAADLGLDTKVFNQCLDQNKYAQKVVDETEAAKNRGVKGTPSFFINDEFIEGDMPFDQMKDIIEKHLRESS